MACERCRDIHIGQIKGNISTPCHCLCHKNPTDRKPKHHLFGDWYCQVCLTTHRKNQVCSA